MFKDITIKPAPFFNILPEDWQESIVPIWNVYNNTAKVYIIEIDHKIVVGGIVFSGMPPEMESFKKEALQWIDKGYFYIGYVWTAEEERGKNYGSKWLTYLKEQSHNTHYWLTTENKDLRYFYEKNGFTFVKTLQNNSIVEDLFIL